MRRWAQDKDPINGKAWAQTVKKINLYIITRLR